MCRRDPLEPHKKIIRRKRGRRGRHFKESSTPLRLDTRWQCGSSMDTKSRGVSSTTQSLTTGKSWVAQSQLSEGNTKGVFSARCWGRVLEVGGVGGGGEGGPGSGWCTRSSRKREKGKTNNHKGITYLSWNANCRTNKNKWIRRHGQANNDQQIMSVFVPGSIPHPLTCRPCCPRHLPCSRHCPYPATALPLPLPSFLIPHSSSCHHHHHHSCSHSRHCPPSPSPLPPHRPHRRCRPHLPSIPGADQWTPLTELALCCSTLPHGQTLCHAGNASGLCVHGAAPSPPRVKPQWGWRFLEVSSSPSSFFSYNFFVWFQGISSTHLHHSIHPSPPDLDTSLVLIDTHVSTALALLSYCTNNIFVPFPRQQSLLGPLIQMSTSMFPLYTQWYVVPNRVTSRY